MGEGLIHTPGGRIFLLLTWAFLCSLVALACLTARTALLPVLRAIFPRMSVKHGAGWWALVLFGFWLSGPILLAAHWFAAPPVTAFLTVVQRFWWVPLVLAGSTLIGFAAWVLWRRREPVAAEPMYVMPPAPVESQIGRFLPEGLERSGL